MNIRQLFDYTTWTYTYLIWDDASKEAAIIDPVLEQVERDSTLIRELNLKLLYIVDTHIHADHITGSSHLRDHFPQAKVGLSSMAKVKGSDIALNHNIALPLGESAITALQTPGHTSGCISYYIPGAVFTGDSLLIRGTGRTDFQEGNSKAMYHSITKILFELPDDTVVYPGHDYKGRMQSTIAEEKAHNPRISGKSEQEYANIMSALNLPAPKRLDIAVPANMYCGKPTTS